MQECLPAKASLGSFEMQLRSWGPGRQHRGSGGGCPWGAEKFQI